jgi:hypothetical protein
MEEHSTNNPIEHAANIRKKFLELIEHLRSDVKKVEDVSAKALFEVSAEVLVGLNKAFEDFEKKCEPAWQKKQSNTNTDEAK